MSPPQTLLKIVKTRPLGLKNLFPMPKLPTETYGSGYLSASVEFSILRFESKSSPVNPDGQQGSQCNIET